MQLPIRLLQMNSDENVMGNAEWIAEHLSSKHPLIMAPENALYCGRSNDLLEASKVIRGSALPFLLRELRSRAPKCVLVLGGVAMVSMSRGATGKMFFNRWVEIRQTGIRWGYRKIHLFRSRVSGQRAYDETVLFQSGKKTAITYLRFKKSVYKIGASICFDLRFPDHYQQLRKQGAAILAVPSAFTKKTGEAHWHTLLRARAIENQCFVIAPAQTGEAPGNRHAYGHTLVIDPWGEVVVDGGTSVGVVDAALNIDHVKAVRRSIILR